MVGLVTSAGLIMLILKVGWRFGLLNRASEAHHTHTVPVPRVGGIAFAGALVAVVLVLTFLMGAKYILDSHLRMIIVAALAMFALGIWDDLFTLGAKRKLVGQVVIASFTCFSGLGIFAFQNPISHHTMALGIWAWPVTVIWLVAMTNLINLIDGVDGLAGGISLMLMVLLFYVSLGTGFMPVLAAGMAGALVGFLRFNFPPARIYMGDGGAYFLGFLIGCTTIFTSQKGTVLAALIAPLFVLALPILDTSLAILRRGLRGLPLFRADRKHIHHRLLASGHSRRKVVLGLYGFTAIFLLLGFGTFFFEGNYLPLFLGLGVLFFILLAGRFDFSREWFSVGRIIGNSIEARANVRYAMSLANWLALSGTRVETLGELAEDVVFIARKLGFATVRIRLKDEEKTWALSSPGPVKNCPVFRHVLPGYKYCFIEMQIACPCVTESSNAELCKKCEKTNDILADLVAEGWIKAVRDWKKTTQLPLRFDARMSHSPAGEKPLPGMETYLGSTREEKTPGK
ncbi:MAG: MraY family glycosyltransferase [Verrucomicrobiota bacterium]